MFKELGGLGSFWIVGPREQEIGSLHQGVHPGHNVGEVAVELGAEAGHGDQSVCGDKNGVRKGQAGFAAQG